MTRLITLTLSAVLLSAFMASVECSAQDATPAERVKLFDSQDKTKQDYRSTGVEGLSAKRIRQARALYRSQQRDARIEHNLWMGYEPLRPNWSAVPMTSSRYDYRRTIYVPVYYYRR